MMNYKADSFSRTQLAYMEKHSCSPEEAKLALDRMILLLEAGEEIRSSFALQAAFLTSVNTGKRAFAGGVYLKIEADIPCLIHWNRKCTLLEAAKDLGGEPTFEKHQTPTFTLRFGLRGEIDHDSLEVVANGWQGGYFSTANEKPLPIDHNNLPIGGIFAAGLAVGTAFLKKTGIEPSAGDYSAGISLWRPDLQWRLHEVSGPVVESLPKRYWLLGLGHLGQAYCWTISMLPYSERKAVSIMLQDDGNAEPGNYSAGLLSEEEDGFFKRKKTRLTATWLENREMSTTITERLFDDHTHRKGEEPFIALCGFDNAASRAILEEAGFDYIAEASLGGAINDFDRISIHTFPNSVKSAKDRWAQIKEEPFVHNVALEQLIKTGEERCGLLEVAGKSISVSFVGACASALLIAEVLRGTCGGHKYESGLLSLRALFNGRLDFHSTATYRTELIKNGLLLAEAGVNDGNFHS